MNLDDIKRKKLEELQNKMQEQQNQQVQEELKLQQQIEVLEEFVKKHLTKEAIQRYGNLKAAHKEKAIQVITLIAQALQSGQITDKISDEQFKQILKQLQPDKREFKIRRT
jgi:programmed cell death protein 5|tara:strand:- start:3725 stop:4057 length:333 start_codon:yes stop_codon:yes gene_type:complete